jgi:hippurate hydrolase
MLLSAARHLAATRNFDGTVHAVFQPVEEGSGGARRMIEEGFFDRFPCDTMFAMHNVPGLPEGRFAIVPGPAMASADTCIIRVHGKGSHAAMPQAGVDTVLVTASIVVALQSIVSRNLHPLEMGVVTVGAMLAGQAPNVIPGEGELRLSVRAYTPAVRDLLERRIAEVAQAQASVFGARAEVDYQRRYPVVLNDADQAALCRRVVTDWCGDDGLIPNPQRVPGSDDFAFFLERVPGCYLFMGNGEGQ